VQKPAQRNKRCVLFYDHATFEHRASVYLQHLILLQVCADSFYRTTQPFDEDDIENSCFTVKIGAASPASPRSVCVREVVYALG
jgi:hypothetical protein